MSSVSPITTRAWNSIGDFASLQVWDGVLDVNQVWSQGRTWLGGNLNIVGAELSGYWLRGVLDEGQRPPNGGRCVLLLAWDCSCASRWTGCLLDDVGRIPVTLKHPSCGGTTVGMQTSTKGFNATLKNVWISYRQRFLMPQSEGGGSICREKLNYCPFLMQGRLNSRKGVVKCHVEISKIVGIHNDKRVVNVHLPEL